MTWLEAQKKMEERGYTLKATGRRPSSADVTRLTFIKEIGSVKLEAHVETPVVDCDTCWKVKILYYGLKMFMAIDSQFFRFHDDSLFARVEEQVFTYAHVITNSHTI